MATKAATYLAFRSVVKRSLTTSTPTRAFPRPNHLNFHTPHQALASKATRGRKLPKNHFTSHSPLRQNNDNDNDNDKDKEKPAKEKKDPKHKRNAAHRPTQPSSLRRVAVEAQRSRGGLIRGKGKTRHVDPDAETRDVTAYCAAEEYNLHVVKDLLQNEGYHADPFDTGLFPDVLHVQTPPAWFRGKVTDVKAADGGGEETGDVFIFPSGSIVTWNVSENLGHHLVERLLLPAAVKKGDLSALAKFEQEDLEYIEDPTREHSICVGDTILLGTKPSSSEPTTTNNDQQQQQQDTAGLNEDRTSETDTTLAKLAFSSALARSTKLAVLENALDAYMQQTRTIPSDLALGQKPSVTRAFVLRKTGLLLSLRGQLNLYSELTDSLPDIFWDSPHELGLENYYDQISSVLDVEIRIKLLNEKMDYASETAAVLREALGERHGHSLEWIIIWLIVIEVLFGCYHIARERVESADPLSQGNLAREWYLQELERMKKEEAK